MSVEVRECRRLAKEWVWWAKNEPEDGSLVHPETQRRVRAERPSRGPWGGAAQWLPFQNEGVNETSIKVSPRFRNTATVRHGSGTSLTSPYPIILACRISQKSGSQQAEDYEVLCGGLNELSPSADDVNPWSMSTLCWSDSRRSRERTWTPTHGLGML